MPGVLLNEPDPLDILEAQIQELENKILGDALFNESDTPLAESLVHSNYTVNNAVTSYENIKTMFDRIYQLGNFLDPSYEDLLGSRVGKVRMVLESEGELRQLLQELSSLNDLTNQLSSESLKNIPNLYEKLKVVTENILKLDEDLKETSLKTKELLDNYTASVRAMNQSLLILDAVLSEAEERVRIVKTENQ